MHRRTWITKRCAPALLLLPLALFGGRVLAGAAGQGVFPSQPLKLVVGFAPGTGPDVVARTLGKALGEALKQPLVVDNRAGAGGQIAAQGVAKATADGYTLLLGEVGSVSIAPAAFSKLAYDPAKELVVLSEVARASFVLVVPASSPARDLAGFLAAAKRWPERLNMATFGAGTPGHFGAELLAEQAGFRVEPVHYRATGDAITALVSGDVQAAFVTTALAVPQVNSGRLRALATTAAQRSALLPEVPTFAESGWPQLDFAAWLAVFAPAGTPAPVLQTLSSAVAMAMQQPALQKTLQEAGFTVLGSSRADSERMLKAEAMRWAAVVKASGFKGD